MQGDDKRSNQMEDDGELVIYDLKAENPKAEDYPEWVITDYTAIIINMGDGDDDDVSVGHNGRNTIYGGEGADDIDGNAGDDQL